MGRIIQVIDSDTTRRRPKFGPPEMSNKDAVTFLVTGNFVLIFSE